MFQRAWPGGLLCTSTHQPFKDLKTQARPPLLHQQELSFLPSVSEGAVPTPVSLTTRRPSCYSPPLTVSYLRKHCLFFSTTVMPTTRHKA